MGEKQTFTFTMNSDREIEAQRCYRLDKMPNKICKSSDSKVIELAHKCMPSVTWQKHMYHSKYLTYELCKNNQFNWKK